MNRILSTYDNNIAHPLHIQEKQDLCNLDKIAGRRIEWLCDRSDGDGLLIFPRDLNEYDDQIGESVVFEVNGETLYTNNIMGFIGIGETQIKIGSRFDQGRNDLFMQYMLERVFSINMLDLQYSFNSDSIFDFIIFLFPFFLKRALGQGLYKSYRTYERNDMKLRGVLDVNQHIRLNYPVTTSVAYKTRELTYDNDITQLIRHTIEYIRNTRLGCAVLGNDDETRTGVSQIVEATGSYFLRDRRSVINRNLKPCIHPYYSEYEPLRKLCIQILQHEEIKYGNDKEKVYGVIFDGAWLWEEYLATFIRPMGIQHPKNRIGEGGFSLFVNKRGWRFPDFVGDGIILDAKYKRYADSEIWGVDREDLAQMISYMYVERAEIGVVLCPGNQHRKPSIAHLRGYGKPIARIALPISTEFSYNKFKDEMLNNESEYVACILDLWKSTVL